MSKFSKLAIGQHLSETSFYTVEKVVGKEVQLKTQSGESVVLDSKYVDSMLVSADFFEKEETINKTDAAVLFISHPGVVMTVNFNKKVDEKEVLAEVMKEISGAKLSDIEKAVKMGIKKSINGEPRTIKGYHQGILNELGRVNFVDMDIARDSTKSFNQMRQVDPRTINSMILKGTKYTVK